MEMKIDKIMKETLCNLKCLTCVHQKLCFNLLGGMNLQMKAEDCKDFLDERQAWIAPCKRDDTVYFIDGNEIYFATVHIIEATLMPNGAVAWTIKISYVDTFETMHYVWEHWGYNLFSTQKEAEKELESRGNK